MTTKILHENHTKAEEATGLPLMEAFYTIQGEGEHQGKAAFFIRLAGCDVGCHWCDVKESWDEEAHPRIPVKEIVNEALKHSARLAVITGGEPLMHDLTDLTAELKRAGFLINIETSGSSPLTGQLDWICLSPKKFKAPLPEVYRQAHELKIIVYNKHDLKWAEEEAAKVPSDCKLFLQPEWSKREEVMPLIVDFIKENPRWQMSLQTHKYMNIP